jgi:autotransporter translocation and assembly factor TamB
VSGEVRHEGRPEHMTIRGRLDLDRPRVRPRFPWWNLSEGGGRVAPDVYDPASEILFFDVALHLTEPLVISNESLNVGLVGDVSLTGSNQRIGLLGAMTAVPRGRVTWRSREMVLDAGSVDFQDRFRFWPRYDLTVSCRACESTITVNVAGTLDTKPAINTTSKPEMDQTEINQCLINGVRTREFEGAVGSNVTGFGVEAGYRALTQATGLDKQVRRVLSIDQIDLTTEYSTKQRLYEPRILAAKELFEGKVRMEYSGSLARSDDQKVAIRYRISPELTLQSSWISSQDIPVGDLGLDLKYRWEW